MREMGQFLQSLDFLLTISLMFVFLSQIKIDKHFLPLFKKLIVGMIMTDMYCIFHVPLVELMVIGPNSQSVRRCKRAKPESIISKLGSFNNLRVRWA